MIENIRESVKYLKLSPSRLYNFNEIVKSLKLSTSKRLILDVPTRWNSTYAMLECALENKSVFHGTRKGTTTINGCHPMRIGKGLLRFLNFWKLLMMLQRCSRDENILLQTCFFVMESKEDVE